LQGGTWCSAPIGTYKKPWSNSAFTMIYAYLDIVGTI
jgi:hypothetical protein